MPLIQKTVYIREGDIDKWNAIPNKAEWLSDRLNYPTMAELVQSGDAEVVDVEMVDARKFTEAAKSGKIAKPSMGVSVHEVPSEFNNKNYCEHGQLKGQCLWKGCKYGK